MLLQLLYYPEGGKLWPKVIDHVAWLAETGITDVWLPPACKEESGGSSVGYDTWDFFNLGEFEQKGARLPRQSQRDHQG